MKSLSANVVSEITSTSYIAADLVEFALDTPLYLTNAIVDVEISTDTSGGTQTYLAQGNFMSFSSAQETSELRINNVSIGFTGATSVYVDIALGDSYLHRSIRIYKVWFDKSTLAPIGSPVMVYDGTITGVNVADDPSETVVVFDTSNQFYDFERSAGRKTNEGSQRRFYSADRGMQYSTSDIADIAWGKI